MLPAEVPESPALAAAVRRLVAVVDDPLVQEAGPDHFLLRAIPFLEATPEPDVPALLPLERIISSSEAWCEADPRKSRSHEELVAFLVSPDGAFASPATRAVVMWVPALGLGAMHEGKNRVRFLRDRCGVSTMPGMLTTLSFPDAERLRLVCAELPAGRVYGALLDKRHFTLLACPDLAVPLLRAYGVAEASWPEGGPSLPDVLASRRWNTRGTWTRSIDLEAVSEELAQRLEQVQGSVLDLDGVTLDRAGIRRVAFGALAATGATGVLAAIEPIGAAGIALLVGLALAGGVMLAITGRLLRGPHCAWRSGHAPARRARDAGDGPTGTPGGS